MAEAKQKHIKALAASMLESLNKGVGATKAKLEKEIADTKAALAGLEKQLAAILNDEKRAFKLVAKKLGMVQEPEPTKAAPTRKSGKRTRLNTDQMFALSNKVLGIVKGAGKDGVAAGAIKKQVGDIKPATLSRILKEACEKKSVKKIGERKLTKYFPA